MLLCLDTLANSVRGNFLPINFTPHLLVLVLPHWLIWQKYDCIYINGRAASAEKTQTHPETATETTASLSTQCLTLD